MDLLSVSPQQLTFYAPYNRPQSRTVTLLNPTDVPILFKVKSDAHNHYRMKPSYGKAKPYDTTEIRISLQCFYFDKNQEYNHTLTIFFFYKPICCNGESALSIFRRLPRREIFTNTLPVKLETKSLGLSKFNMRPPPSLNQLIMERQKQLRPLCPRWSEVLAEISDTEKPPSRSIASVVIIIVILLGVYLLPKELTEMLTNFYHDLMDHLEDFIMDFLGDSCMDNSQENMESPQGNTLDSSQYNLMDSSQGTTMDSSQGNTMDSSQYNLMDSSQGNSLNCSQGNTMNTSQYTFTDNSHNTLMDNSKDTLNDTSRVNCMDDTSEGSRCADNSNING